MNDLWLEILSAYYKAHYSDFGCEVIDGC